MCENLLSRDKSYSKDFKTTANKYNLTLEKVLKFPVSKVGKVFENLEVGRI